MDSLCRTGTPLVLGDLDLAIPVGVLGWLVRRLERETVAAVTSFPSPHGWFTSPTCTCELACLFGRTAEAWVVQRPGCSGLVTRLVLLDDLGRPLAAVGAAREPGMPEPVAWRVILLMALLAGDHGIDPMDEEHGALR